ncbi:hypothetical protein MRX96_052226 [Rhipicephalus microplus]
MPFRRKSFLGTTNLFGCASNCPTSSSDALCAFLLVGSVPAFDGQLSELRDHMRRCRSMDVKCAKCNRPVARDVALDHYKQCIDGNAWRVSVYDLPVQRGPSKKSES